VPAIPDECRFTTEEMLATERQVIESCLQRNAEARERAHEPAEVSPRLVHGSWGVERRPVTEAVVGEALGARPSLCDEQRAMVRHLTMGPDAVLMVRGHAGTGKTSALDACREIWEQSGRTVIGCALSGRAAAELQAGSAIQSSTIDRFLLDLVDHRRDLLSGRHTVLVVDEAGMVGTRLIARVLGVAKSEGATVVLVGDDRQLPEIDAGGAYHGLCERLGAVELTENRRQREEWERQALVLLREGRSHEALAAYVEHGRVVLGPSGDCVRARLVADWWAAKRTGDGDNVMVALRRADVGELNERARALRVAAGDVAGPTLRLPTGEFAAGDRVLTTRNRRGLGVVNGSRGTVAAVDEHERTLTVRLDGTRRDEGRTTVLPAEYLDAGHVTHAYAITGHKAQGMTVDRSFVLGDEAMYREWGYVALSRGRAENRLYVVAGELDPTNDTGHGRVPTDASDRRVLDVAATALRESRDHRLALDQFEAVAGPLPSAWPAPPPPPPAQYLDDAQLRAAAAAAREDLRSRSPFGDLAEPHLVDPARTVAELSGRHRYLTERRAVLEAHLEARRTRLEATDGLIARRRHRQERDGLQRDLRLGARDVANIDRQLPELAARLERIRSDQVAMDSWYRLRADGARRCRALYNEARARIDHRVQAAQAAPSLAGHPAPPTSLSAQWGWQSSARDVEHTRLWDGTAPSPSYAAQRPERSRHRQGQPTLAVGKQIDVASVLDRVDSAERRRERQVRQTTRPIIDRHHDYLTRQHEQLRHAQQHAAHGPTLSP
jgi:hypothetical protein